MQRRNLSGAFASVGNVAARGDGAYDFVDRGVGAGTHYYRLRSIDLDGSDETSEVVAATIAGGAGEAGLTHQMSPHT